MNELFKSDKEAAAYIGVKPSTLALWRHQKRGPRYFKIGRKCFYRESDIETWLDGQAVVPVHTTRRRWERDDKTNRGTPA